MSLTFIFRQGLPGTCLYKSIDKAIGLIVFFDTLREVSFHTKIAYATLRGKTSHRRLGNRTYAELTRPEFLIPGTSAQRRISHRMS